MKPDYQQIFVVMFYKWRSKLWDQEDLSMHYGDQGYPSTGTDHAHCRAARGGSNHPRWASGRAAARQLPQGPTKTITLPIHGNSVLSILALPLHTYHPPFPLQQALDAHRPSSFLRALASLAPWIIPYSFWELKLPSLSSLLLMWLDSFERLRAS